MGYSGGNVIDPNYKAVCSGLTGHAEVVHIEYDTEQVSYSTLVDFFFRMFDPTTLNRQGNDWGTQYRSVILAHNPEQKRTAVDVMNRIKVAFGSAELSTTLEDFKEFYDGEDYHQVRSFFRFSFASL